MNPTQKILNLLLKMGYAKDFESSFTDEDFDLSMNINASFKDFKVEHAIEGSEGITIIRWDSLIDKTVACMVVDSEIYLSTPQLYKTSTKRLKGFVKHHLSDLMIEMVESETQTLKNLFLEYAPDAQRYFR